MSENPPASYAESIVSSLTEGVVVFDKEGRVRIANPALLALLGREGAQGAALDDLFPSGSELNRLARRALQGELAENEDVQHRAPGQQTRWLRVNATRLRGTREPGTLLTLKEVSDLKRAERQMWQVEKMSALGRLAASVAHEVCNPLGAIDIQLQLLEEDLGAVDGELAEKVGRRLRISRAEMRRLDGIVQNFLRFSRPPALHLKRVSPNELLRHIHALVEPESRERGLELVLALDEELPHVEVDENQMSQALLNLLINAFQAVDRGGRVLLSSAPGEAGEILLEVSDTGHGIATEDLERIFEFYYTTKDEGTGLGLSIAQRIVHQHGGTLVVESQEGEGTQVFIRLPACRN